MPISMTGFASVSTAVPPFELVWEIRTVNHRFLDVTLRVPDELKRLESNLRERLTQRVRRGKVDCTLRVNQVEGDSASPQIAAAELTRLEALQAQVLRLMPNARPLSVQDILRSPGVIVEPRLDLTAHEAQIVAGFEAATIALHEARCAEGARTAEAILQRVAVIEAGVAAAGGLLEDAEARYRTRLMERIDRLEQPLEPGRLEQEMLFVAQRMDIAEELDRLRSHTAEIRQIMARDEPVGRRLDFLIQELNREANTLSSKSPDDQLTRLAVDLKVAIEQMREQVQNIE